MNRNGVESRPLWYDAEVEERKCFIKGINDEKEIFRNPLSFYNGNLIFCFCTIRIGTEAGAEGKQSMGGDIGSGEGRSETAKSSDFCSLHWKRLVPVVREAGERGFGNSGVSDVCER